MTTYGAGLDLSCHDGKCKLLLDEEDFVNVLVENNINDILQKSIGFISLYFQWHFFFTFKSASSKM